MDIKEATSTDQLAAHMEAPLLAIAEHDIDIVPLVFERFLAQHPEYRKDFYNLEAAAGRMVNETIEAMVGIADGAYWVATTITNFVELHRDYGVYSPDLYSSFVDIVVDTLEGAAGEAWTADVNAAWRAQAKQLCEMIAETTARTAALS